MAATDTAEQIDEWLGSDGSDMPALGRVAAEIAIRCDDPQTAAERLAEIVEREPVLGARVLRLVNSAYFGLSEDVTSVQHAVRLLGHRTVRTVALTAAVLGAFNDTAGGVFDLDRFWRHSLSVAAGCRALAAHCRAFDAETAFTLGLLHDIGKLVLVRYRPDDIGRVVRDARERDVPFIDSERDMLPFAHPTLGAWLIGRWHLPAALVDGVGRHHDDDLDAENPLAAALAFADYLAIIKSLTASGSHGRAAIRRDAWVTLGLEPSHVPELIDGMNHELDLAQQLIGDG